MKVNLATLDHDNAISKMTIYHLARKGRHEGSPWSGPVARPLHSTSFTCLVAVFFTALCLTANAQLMRPDVPDSNYQDAANDSSSAMWQYASAVGSLGWNIDGWGFNYQATAFKVGPDWFATYASFFDFYLVGFGTVSDIRIALGPDVNNPSQVLNGDRLLICPDYVPRIGDVAPYCVALIHVTQVDNTIPAIPLCPGTGNAICTNTPWWSICYGDSCHVGASSVTNDGIRRAFANVITSDFGNPLLYKGFWNSDMTPPPIASPLEGIDISGGSPVLVRYGTNWAVAAVNISPAGPYWGYGNQGGSWDITYARDWITQVAGILPPVIKCQVVDTNLVVSWYADGTSGYVLQASTDLVNWSPEEVVPTTDSGRSYVQLPQSACRCRFWRLVKEVTK